MTTSVTPEQRLIFDCIRSAFGVQSSSTINTPIDWDLFLARAARSGVIRLVQTGLRRLALEPPQPIRARLCAADAAAAIGTKAWLEPTLRESLRALTSAGLQPILLKGPALAYLAYPRPADRTFIDIDLLLPGDQLDRAARALQEAGFLRTAAHLDHGHQHLPPYLAPHGKATVELHHHLLSDPNPYAMDLERLRARSEFREVAGVTARVLAPIDTLHHVCVHLAYGHRYRWFPLRSMVDILALTTHTASVLDWDLFVQEVLSSRTSGAVYWPLRLSRQWLAAAIPEHVLSVLTPHSSTRRLFEPVLLSPYILDSQAPAGWGTDVLYGLLRELSLRGGCSGREQLGAVWRNLFPSPEAINHLPPQLTRSRLRYAAYLGGPGRVARGLVALLRLLAQLPRAIEPG